MASLVALVLAVATGASGNPAPAGASATLPRPVEKLRGVSWVAGREVRAEDIAPLKRAHVNWIVQTPFGWQDGHDTPTVRLATDGGIFWGETDVGLESTARLARAAGIKTLLKPHVWLRHGGGKWRADIAMKDEQDWKRWFDSYRAFILHYARLAQRTGMEALCVGTELRATVVQRERDWRRLIAEVREVYDGPLVYAANWYEEFEQVGFWDALDYIGVQAYFPLSDVAEPAVDQLVRGWRPHLEALERVQRRTGKPVLFTEIGYRSVSAPANRPWEWPERPPERTATDGALRAQASCYEAFFETFWERKWFAGAFFWKWYPTAAAPARATDTDFSPQGKPAERVLSRWFGDGRLGEVSAE